MNFESVHLLDIQWQDVKDFFNSVFFTAIAGSLAGAFAGAYGAQRIIERAKYRDELLKEIRNTNAATNVTFGICNSLLSLKKQHVKALKETFDAQKLDFLNHQNKVRVGEICKDQVFNFLADLQSLSLPQLPVDILQAQVFEKLSLMGRPLNLATTLSQTAHSLSESLEKRNQLIEFYKVNALARKDGFVALYFGLPQDGHINQDYASSLDAIYNQTDDGIFFSQLLCKDLVEHGEQIAARFKKKYGKDAPTINKPDFTKAETLGLMPEAENYADWAGMFVKSTGSLTVLEKIRRWMKRH